MGVIVGIAEYYSDKRKMRASVFRSRTERNWDRISTSIDQACKNLWTNTDFGYYKKGSSILADDKFGLKLWDTLSFGTTNFEYTVKSDEDLTSELTCHYSNNLAKAQNVMLIWLHAIEQINPTSMPIPYHSKRRSNQKTLREQYRHIGEALGIDTMFEAYKAGVPFEYIIS